MQDWKLGRVERNGTSEGLVVLLHGFGKDSNNLNSMAGVITKTLPNVDFLRPNLPYACLACTDPAIEIVKTIITAIDKATENRNKLDDGAEYKYIRVVGHSFGAVIARRVILVAHGAVKGLRWEPEIDTMMANSRPWACKIDRLVLMAGMLRGWEVSSAMGPLQKIGWRIGNFIGEIFTNRKFTIFDIRRGARFLVQTRLHWIRFQRDRSFDKWRFPVVQLLGTVDDMVSPEDNIDYLVDSSSGNFSYISVPRSGHADIVNMQYGDNLSSIPNKAQTRAKYFTIALAGTINEIEAAKDKSSVLINGIDNFVDTSVRDVVFVIHGIRDRGYWTKKIANAVHTLAEQRRRPFAYVTESYGYFGMAPFALPWIRYRKVEWLMDVYANACARYPDANFHYVGHSNGTYLAARALRDYPACSFDNVVFAGSVVRRDYPWSSMMPADGTQPHEKETKHKVQRVMNYVASSDYVVAMLPKGLQAIRGADLGSAGHDGFEQQSGIPNLHPIRFIKGGHAAGIVESQWDEIAKFIVDGKTPDVDTAETQADLVNEQNYFLKLLGSVSGISWILILTVFAAILAFAYELLFGNWSGTSANRVAFYAFLLSAAIVALKSILTKL